MTKADFSLVYGPTDQNNVMLPLALGALAMLDVFAEATAETHAGSATEATDDAVLAAALGLLSLRRTVRRWAGHAAGDHTRAAPRAGRRPLPSGHIMR